MAHDEQPLKMLIGLEGAHAFCVSIFGGVEHLRVLNDFVRWLLTTASFNSAPSSARVRKAPEARKPALWLASNVTKESISQFLSDGNGASGPYV
jgi:hypothetical protein